MIFLPIFFAAILISDPIVEMETWPRYGYHQGMAQSLGYLGFIIKGELFEEESGYL